MIQEYLSFIIFLLVVFAIGAGALAVTSILGPRRLKSKSKFDPYECGVDQMSSAHKPFAVKFYVFALLFILFDIETIFLIPWAIQFRTSVGMATLWEVGFFLAVLGLGLFYILKTKALDWK